MAEDGTLDPREPGAAPEPTGAPAEQHEWVLPPEARSRRHFLRTAVISSAAAAAVVGGGAVLATTPLGPKLLGAISPAKAAISPNTCIPIIEGSKGSPQSPNMTLQIDTGNAGDFRVGSQIKIVDKNHANQFELETVTAVVPQQGNNVTQVHITPGITGDYPSGSCIFVLVF